MQGKTHIAIEFPRTIDHLDPNSTTHIADQIESKQVRQKNKQMFAERADLRPLQGFKFPTLGRGFMAGKNGLELSGPAHKKLLTEATQARAWYWSDGEREDGVKRRRKRKTKGIHTLAVLMRPDQVMALEVLDKNPKYSHLTRPLIIEIMKAIGIEFESATGLEVIAYNIHCEEGCLHLHLTYASVSAENELLWSRCHAGRHGLRLLGPSHGGTLRLIKAGFLQKSEGVFAIKDFLDRVSKLEGDRPIDWQLACLIEGMIEVFSEKHKLRSVFNEAAEKYRGDLLARRAERPDALKAAKNKAEAERDSLAHKVAELTAKVAELTAKQAAVSTAHSSPVLQKSVVPASHPNIAAVDRNIGPSR